MTVQRLFGEVFNLVYVLLANNLALSPVVYVPAGDRRSDTYEYKPVS